MQALNPAAKDQHRVVTGVPEQRRHDVRRGIGLIAVGVIVVFHALPARLAHGGSLTGKLRLPAQFAEPPLVGAGVFWELPNPLLPLASPPVDLRRSMVVVLEGPAKAPPIQRSSVFVLTDARFEPPVLAVAPGAKLTFENNDPVMHLIESPPGSPSPMKARSLAPGDAVTHVFAKEGTYRLHCSEVPHMRATVLVTKQPLVALPKNDGSFAFANVPQDRYLLRVWYDGRWIHSMGVRVRTKTSVEVQISAAESTGQR